ncbi:hypothetical protein GCM10027289_01050 [Tsukamurella serpentis]
MVVVTGYAVVGGVYGGTYVGSGAPVCTGTAVVGAAGAVDGLTEEADGDDGVEEADGLDPPVGFTVNDGTEPVSDGAQPAAAPRPANRAVPARTRVNAGVRAITVNAICNIGPHPSEHCNPHGMSRCISRPATAVPLRRWRYPLVPSDCHGNAAPPRRSATP